MKTTYTALRKLASKTLPDVSAMSDDALRDAIQQISRVMIEHGLGNGERIELNEDRRAYRAELARRGAA